LLLDFHTGKLLIQMCLPLKIREIKKQLGTKDSKIQGEILKTSKRLNSSPKAPRKKEGFIEMLKKKILRKELNVKTLQIQIENIIET
jgi:hypothetical protein